MPNLSRRNLIRAAAAGGLAGAWPVVGHAQNAAVKWPVGTIKFMAPVPPGGGVDLLCRRIADRENECFRAYYCRFRQALRHL